MQLQFEAKYGKIVDYSLFGDGYIVIGFSSGYLSHVSAHTKEINDVYKKFKYFVFLLKFTFIPFKYNNYGKTEEHDKILRSKFILNLLHIF